MRRLYFVISMVLVVAFMTSCTAYSRFNSAQMTKFKHDIQADYKNLKKVDFKYAPSCFIFQYSFTKGANKEEMFEVFRKTKNLIQNQQFQKEFFEQYFNEYFKEERIYPKVYINFDLNNDKKFEYQFNSMYYKQTYNSGGNNEVDEYKTWGYWDFKSDSKPIE